jgi:hypothetical protein
MTTVFEIAQGLAGGLAELTDFVTCMMPRLSGMSGGAAERFGDAVGRAAELVCQVAKHGRAAAASAVAGLLILSEHQPGNAHGGEQGRHRVVFDRGPEVAEKLTTVFLGEGQRLIDQLPRRQFVFQCIDDVLDVGPSRVDVALDCVRAVAGYALAVITAEFIVGGKAAFDAHETFL